MKNIAKTTAECCSNSHFSHVRDEVGKPPYYLSCWVLVWGNIAPKSVKNRFEIVIKICSIIHHIFQWLWVDFGPSGRPLGVAGDGQRTVFFPSPWNPKWLQDLAQEPLGHPRASNFYDFCKIFNRIRLRFFIVCWFRHGGGKAEGNWIGRFTSLASTFLLQYLFRLFLNPELWTFIHRRSQFQIQHLNL